MQGEELTARVDRALRQFVHRRNGEHDLYFSTSLLN